jgi:hypothetical protein
MVPFFGVMRETYPLDRVAKPGSIAAQDAASRTPIHQGGMGITPCSFVWADQGTGTRPGIHQKEKL